MGTVDWCRISLERIAKATGAAGVLLGLLASAFSFGVGAAFETKPPSTIRWSNEGVSDWTGLGIGYFLVAAAIATASAMMRLTERRGSGLMSAGALGPLLFAGFQMNRIVAFEVDRWPENWEVSPILRSILPNLPPAMIVILSILFVVVLVTVIREVRYRSE